MDWFVIIYYELSEAHAFRYNIPRNQIMVCIYFLVALLVRNNLLVR